MRSNPRTLLASASAVALLATLVACAPATDDAEDLSLSIPVDSIAANWDPAQGALGGGLYAFDWQAVYDVLGVWRPEQQAFEPRLAEAFEFNDDRTRLTMTLRDDVDFVDGEHMTAAGVAEYFTALLAGGQYIFAGNVAAYGLEFTATDEYTLELTATKPIYVPDFWALTGLTPVLSPAALDDPEKANSTPLGSGPYVIEDVVAESEMTLVRNPDYWDPEAYPYDTIVLKVIPDPVAKLNALKSGQVDVAELGLGYVAEAQSAGMELTEAVGLFRTLWVYDPANSPLEPLRDVRVRQAMMWAFDRDAIAETIDQGYGRVTSQAFNPGQPEHIEGGDDRYGFDLEKARDLMAEAGYADGFDVVIPSYSDAAAVEPIVQQTLADIGIRVTYEQFADRLEWFKAAGSGLYPLILEPLQGPAYTLRGLVADYPGLGRLFAANPEIDALLEVIEQGDDEESAAASQEMGERLLDEAWYIPFSRPSKIWASIPAVSVTASVTEVTLPASPELRDFAPAG